MFDLLEEDFCAAGTPLPNFARSSTDNFYHMDLREVEKKYGKEFPYKHMLGDNHALAGGCVRAYLEWIIHGEFKKPKDVDVFYHRYETIRNRLGDPLIHRVRVDVDNMPYGLLKSFDFSINQAAIIMQWVLLCWS